MSLTRTTLLRSIKIGAGIILATLIIAYAIWRSLSYARGPNIVIDEPSDGASISTPTAVIKGHVERANNIILNGRSISIDEQGNFNETLIVFPGANVITLEAHDQFQRTIKTELRLQGI